LRRCRQQRSTNGNQVERLFHRYADSSRLTPAPFCGVWLSCVTLWPRKWRAQTVGRKPSSRV